MQKRWLECHKLYSNIKKHCGLLSHSHIQNFFLVNSFKCSILSWSQPLELFKFLQNRNPGFFFKEVIYAGCLLSSKPKSSIQRPFISKTALSNEWMNEWMIYLMSKWTWEVFAQSSKPEAHVKNARQTKKYKTRQNVDYAYTSIKKNLKTS